MMESLASPSDAAKSVALVVFAVALTSAVGVFSLHALSERYRSELVAEGTVELNRQVDLVQGWFDRYRSLAPIYARDPRVTGALEDAGDPGRTAALNRALEVWNGLAGTSDTYLMGADGTTIAASNFGEPTSFIGNNFSYRPYFQEAMQGRLGRFFGLGTTSGLRGYYFAAPVRGPEGVLGVVAVKISIEQLEQQLRLSPHAVFVSDDAGVVILAGNPLLRLTALTDMSEAARAEMRATRKFEVEKIGAAPIGPVGSWLDGAYPVVSAPTDRGGGGAGTFLHLSAPMAAENWTLHLLLDVAVVRERFLWSALALGAVLLAVLALASAIWQRRRRLVERLRDRERAGLALERRVAERTAELSEANTLLKSEISERCAAEANLRQTQSELVQAGKLAALGQMSAALSHEFNQPLTAIRTYAENAIAFYEAGAREKAGANLGRVLRLTERMAHLSKHLTRFARRSQETVTPVTLDSVIDEALGLLQGRIERAEAVISVEGERGLVVLGGAVRLQHVIMNLVGNALDAVSKGSTPEIAVSVRRVGEAVEIAVEDNGTGISEDALPHIFDPFFTTKEVGKGLGLGLSISYNIVKDFGGRMRAENRQGGGARFVVTLRPAEAHEAAK